MTTSFESSFREAVTAIDLGDVPALTRILGAEPRLARDRLESPGEWLTGRIGEALEGFFQRPYLLWFIAEDPIRNGSLPANIADVARTIIGEAKRAGGGNLQEQLDYALHLVCWSSIAPEAGVQIDLIDVLLDAGASPVGAPDNALVNGNRAAAEHLLARGAPVTLAAAVALGRWDDARTLLKSAGARDRQKAFVLAALHGSVEGLRVMLRAGVEVSMPCQDLYGHATPLHHAVWSGSLEAVQVLVDAGADLSARDTVYHGAPQDWAEHAAETQSDRGKAARYSAIADYLRTAQERSVDQVLEELYSGPKAALRPIHERLMGELEGLGEFEWVPKKTYISYRRKKQFAMIGPPTNARVEVGLNMKGVTATERLEALPAGQMCNYKVRLSEVEQVDAELLGWVRTAYEAAG